MSGHKTPLELGRRERQIVESVIKLEEASVAEVRDTLEDPPSYSTVRTMLGVLVGKKWLKQRREGKRILYRPSAGPEKTRQTAITRLVETFFAGSPVDAMASLLESSASDLTDQELKRMADMINQARKENR